MKRLKAALAFDPALTLLPHLLDAPLWQRLEAVCDLTAREPLPHYGAGLAEIEVLITGWGAPVLDAAAIAGAPSLRLVAHAAGTVKTLVTPALWARGITVVSAAEANAVPVAEFTLAAILFSAKEVFALAGWYQQHRNLRRAAAPLFPRAGVTGARVGIVGASAIGRRVIELLRPFDMQVLVYDPFLTGAEAAALGVTKLSLNALLSVSDVVSLHAPLLPETRGMLGRAELAALRDGATLINTARGALVDSEALTAELVSGRLSAVLDVTDPEPLPDTSPLWGLSNVLLTPHIAGTFTRDLRLMGELVVAEIERFARGEPLRHVVAPERLAVMA